MAKKTAGATSPAYGIATGEGAMGKASRKGLFGAIPRMVTKSAQDTARKMPRGEVAYPQEKESSLVQNRAKGGMMNKKGYAAGGVVKARGMGAATRGGKCKMS